MAASATAAFIAENAATLGLVAGIAALVAGIVYLATHWKQVWNALKAPVIAVADFVKDHWKLLIVGLGFILLGPLGAILALMIDALVTHWHAVVDGFRTAYAFVAGIVRDALGVIKAILAPFLDWEIAVTKAELGVVEDTWRASFAAVRAVVSAGVTAVKAVLSWFGQLAGLFRGWWDDAVRAVSSEIGKLIGFVESIPGRINSALGGLPSMMFNAGIDVIESLIDGIMSMVGRLGSVMGGIASKVAGFFGLSPAKEGPLSGGGAPEIRGRHIAEDIAAGMASGLPRIGTAAARLAGAAALGAAASPALAGAGAGGPARVEINLTGGDAAFRTWLKKTIRTTGGDVTILGR